MGKFALDSAYLDSFYSLDKSVRANISKQLKGVLDYFFNDNNLLI